MHTHINNNVGGYKLIIVQALLCGALGTTMFHTFSFIFITRRQVNNGRIYFHLTAEIF